MRFHETPLPGVWLIEPDRLVDERGWFARTFDADEFRARGLSPDVVQCNSSVNFRRGTLRGMHYQAAPHGEPQLVRCVRGAIFDVAADLRRSLPSFCQWYGAELSAANGLSLYIPDGVAHGFQTIQDETEVLYNMGHRFVPEAARGVRWDDPALGIEWPAVSGDRVISGTDHSYPDLDP